MSRRTTAALPVALLMHALVYVAILSSAANKKNMLLVYIDDLRADINAAYGRTAAITPNLDRFAKMRSTTVLGRAYANYPMCSPSRISTLYGLLPTRTGVLTNLDEDTQDTDTPPQPQVNPSLPKFLQSQGYYTATGGKVFHEAGINGDGCWNNTFYPTQKQTIDWCKRDGRARQIFYPKSKVRVTPQICVTRSPLSKLRDIILVKKAVETLTTIVENNYFPFFLAVGFYKPHIPFQVHQSFWVQTKHIPDAERISPPGPPEAYTHPDLTYTDDANRIYAVKPNIADLNIDGKPNADFRKIMRRAYAAGVAQSDFGFGKLLDAMENFNLVSNTLIVVISDHGYYLGENNIWAKNVIFEVALRVPFFVSAPWLVSGPAKSPVNRLTSAFVELVDLYRTTASLLDLKDNVPPTIDGVDQSAIISQTITNGEDPNAGLVPSGNSIAVVARCDNYSPCTNKKVDVTAMGLTYRDNANRYTVWLRAFANRTIDWTTKIAEEFYSHADDNSTIFKYTDASYNTEDTNSILTQPSLAATYLQKLRQSFANL